MLVRTDPDAPKHRGITWLIVPDGHCRASTSARCARWRAPTEFCEVFFDDVRVPVANRVGDENDGWRVAMVTLSFERGTAFVSDVLESMELVPRPRRAGQDDHEQRCDPLGRRRPAPRARPHRRRVRRAVGADQAQHLAGAAHRRSSASAATCSSSRTPTCASASATSPCTCSTARRCRSTTSASCPTGRHVHGRFYALSMTHRRGHVAGAAQHRRRARARPAEGPLSRWTSSSPTTRSRSRRACASFLDGRFPLDAVRGHRRPAVHLDRGRWRELGETGVFSLPAEADGG